MNFVNNWLTQLTAGLAADASNLPITPEALALLPNGDYLLTLSSSLNPAEAAPVEIVAVQVLDGVATVTRGQEGTGPRAWLVGAFIYCAVTAGTINKLAALLGSSSGSGGAIVSPLTYDFNLAITLAQQSFTWSMSGGSATPYVITLPPSPMDYAVRLEIMMLNGSQ